MAVRWYAVAQGHLQGVDDELGAHVLGHRPADDAAGPQVEDDGQVQPTLPRPDVRDVRHPEQVRSGRREVARHQVLGHREAVRRVGRRLVAPRTTALQALRPHQSGDELSAHNLTAFAQFVSNSRAPVDAPTLRVGLGHLHGERRIPQASGALLALRPLIEAAARHLQHAAQHRDRIEGLLH